MVVGKAPEIVAVCQVPEDVAVRYARASPAVAQVERWAGWLPWYLYRQPMYVPSLPG
jgi:hypothetical protein